MNQVSSKIMKRSLMEHLFYRLNYQVVVDEHNFMDVFAIRRSGHAVEFEVKVSKQDLMREIKLMGSEQPIRYSKDWVKWEKHANYLKRTIADIPNRYGYINPNTDVPYFIPNEFYFYVPNCLAEVALMSTQGTPYGVAVRGDRILSASGNTIYDPYFITKPAKKLHEQKVTPDIYRKVAHELTTRNRIFYGLLEEGKE